jgi:sigma-B regulation protein RsbU (phosphoserine phosphatase)
MSLPATLDRDDRGTTLEVPGAGGDVAGDRESERPSSETLLTLQRDANEELVLTTLRAHADVDRAVESREHAELELSESKAREEDLLQTAQFRERLIGIIGHDLRNPLHAIIMTGRVLVRSGDLNEENTAFASTMIETGNRMARMIDELVEFTRTKLGGGMRLSVVDTDLGGVCHAAAQELRIGASANIECTTEGDLLGSWDADRLGQALSNLLGNAVEHAKAGTPVRVHASGDGDGDEVVVEVTNQGEPIPVELLAYVFDAFRGYEVTSSTGGSPGGQGAHLGLGLYIAHEIVRAHGGDLSVRSADGITTFTMELPRRSSPLA